MFQCNLLCLYPELHRLECLGIEVGKQVVLFVEGGELQAVKRFRTWTRDETIENAFAPIGRSWNHEVIDLLEHRIWTSGRRFPDIPYKAADQRATVLR